MASDVIIVIDDREDSRKWAHLINLDEPVLTSPCAGAETLIDQSIEHLHAIFINCENYERGLFLALYAARSLRLFVGGIVSRNLPDALDRETFVVNSVPLTIAKEEDFILEDNEMRVTNWVALYELTRKAIFAVPVTA